MALASSCITGSPWHAEHTIDMRRGKSRNITSGLLLPNSTCAHPRQSVSLVFRSRFFFKLAFRFCFTACPNCRHFQRCFSLSKRVRSQCREPIYGFKVSKTSPKKPVFCFSRLQSCVTDAAFFHIGNRLTGLSFFCLSHRRHFPTGRAMETRGFIGGRRSTRTPLRLSLSRAKSHTHKQNGRRPSTESPKCLAMISERIRFDFHCLSFFFHFICGLCVCVCVCVCIEFKGSRHRPLFFFRLRSRSAGALMIGAADCGGTGVVDTGRRSSIVLFYRVLSLLTQWWTLYSESRLVSSDRHLLFGR